MKPLVFPEVGHGIRPAGVIATGNHGLHPTVVLVEAGSTLCNGAPVVTLIFEARGKTGPRFFRPPE
jgi:hypothetical protein